MDDFYAARSGTIPPLPWPNFAPPLILVAGDRADVDDVALEAALAHRADGCLSALEQREDVGLEHLPPVFGIRIGERPESADLEAGIIDHDVECAGLSHGALDHDVDLRQVAQISGEGDGFASTPLDFLGDRAQPLLRSSDEIDGRAFLAKNPAIERPMPLEAPVTMAVLPDSRPAMVLLPQKCASMSITPMSLWLTNSLREASICSVTASRDRLKPSGQSCIRKMTLASTMSSRWDQLGDGAADDPLGRAHAMNIGRILEGAPRSGTCRKIGRQPRHWRGTSSHCYPNRSSSQLRVLWLTLRQKPLSSVYCMMTSSIMNLRPSFKSCPPLAAS